MYIDSSMRLLAYDLAVKMDISVILAPSKRVTEAFHIERDVQVIQPWHGCPIEATHWAIMRAAQKLLEDAKNESHESA